jgi:outer membrane protein OmpA-like peptidoglycan-associated protein
MYLVRTIVASAAVVMVMGGMAAASDLGALGEKTGKNLGQKASASTMEQFTKKLKKAQNEKGPIRFKKGKSEIDPACDPTMRYIAKLVKESPGFHVQVDGHTDNVGKPENNRKLSQARAEAVVKYLTGKKGVDPGRLSAKGWGDTQPIADNKTDKGRAKNRRVDFTVTKM